MCTESRTADAVVVGGGTVGGWCAWFLLQAGLERVVVVEQSILGSGASSRAAGMVRAQGGTEWAVRLGMWSREFYARQSEEVGIDSGYVAQGYLMPAFDEEAADLGRRRVAMQQSLGLGVEWLGPAEADACCPAMASGLNFGGSYAPDDGYIDPPRNVLAYSAALVRDGAELRERTSFHGLLVKGSQVRSVETSRGSIATDRVVLTGGPEIASVGRLAGICVRAGGVRHQVAVTEPSEALSPERLGMAFDVKAGLYWRPEAGGALFGMSNPDEAPGEARGVDWHYMAAMRERLSELLPASHGLGLQKVWAATIEYTPDRLPIIGPALRDGEVVDGVTVVSAGGHGMMWGPALARAAADLALGGTTDVADVSSLGLDRFDEHGDSRLAAEPIALPFPERTLAND